MKPVKKLWQKLKAIAATDEPEHLRRGKLGERAAKAHLQAQGLKFLTANFRSSRGEIDLVFRDADCLLFVLIKRNIFRGSFGLHEAEAGGQLRPVQHH